MDTTPVSPADCVFCAIVAGNAPAQVVTEWDDALAIIPLDPVTDGHLIVIPRVHVPDAIAMPDVTAGTMYRATELARRFDSSNILTSVGASATQSIFHLHIHVVPRTTDDQLMLPWGTTGNPHDPHLCRAMEVLRAERDELAVGVQTFAADVARLVSDYAHQERDIIALTPFTATLDQLCLEKYGFDLDRVLSRGDARPGSWLDLPAIARENAARICENFPDADHVQQANYCLMEEVGEFIKAYRRWAGMARRTGPWEDVEAELADVVLAAFVAGERLGIDLNAAVLAKAGEVQTRGWRDEPAAGLSTAGGSR